MKKQLAILLTVLCFFSLLVAAGATPPLPPTLSLAEVFAAQMTVEERAFLQNTAYYDKSMGDLVITDQPLIPLYGMDALYRLDEHGVGDAVAARQGGCYMLLDGQDSFIIDVTTDPQKGTAVSKRSYGNIPAFVEALLPQDKTTWEINGTACNIQYAYCFYDYLQGGAIYLYTDAGEWVQYFLYSEAEGYLFGAAEMAEYGPGYRAYCQTLAESGIDGMPSFPHYVNRVHGEQEPPGASPTQNNIPYYIAAAVAVMTVSLVLAGVFLRKKHEEY